MSSIITHITIGTNDMKKARRFYDAAFEALGIKRMRDVEGKRSVYGREGQEGRIIIVKPINGEPATVGNGITIGLAADTDEAVDAFYKAGLEHGGKDAGAPGPRAGANDSYGAYLYDPDGNKICTFNFK
ncbi:MAG: VOC family protein [Zymomonas mobilis subsp. pomaceae]|uniref:Glyoxalase/bleomycin resistance protein/dioxygenase n=1 Tax=Zymomonas mobilis subsp. pomaceae (strain ATCC 29192 / DSM 22645 / JCM 10191 / CCUG 17912 / NBRC 13757 / NCIMB 11200 / NRRL B-4491 / Barker I) TaxID=579138 RepID=F8EV68_ZYMMT|nr:VOC family protein [Zymomonas mobilis]AEI38286.1 Glyoxalase/bleomycin resistance protein/dioxygenase [Zymomonas mobilis subsp. pomaceae ATCC 29192]MDX5947975.1 VOC family protein [Zymomonas mobilis subsp. pomaceae]GEB89304.1 lactoylglutathione lyase [Zymomonas mobilis subsp. pomaceae]